MSIMILKSFAHNVRMNLTILYLICQLYLFDFKTIFLTNFQVAANSLTNSVVQAKLSLLCRYLDLLSQMYLKICGSCKIIGKLQRNRFIIHSSKYQTLQEYLFSNFLRVREIINQIIITKQILPLQYRYNLRSAL